MNTEWTFSLWIWIQNLWQLKIVHNNNVVCFFPVARSCTQRRHSDLSPASTDPIVVPVTISPGRTAVASSKPRSISPSSSFDSSEAEYKPGELVWCKLGNYPFWPSIVSTDRVSRRYVQKSRFGYLTYYVQYLGEKVPVYGWTGAPQRVIPFKGLKEFRRLVDARIAQESSKVRGRPTLWTILALTFLVHYQRQKLGSVGRLSSVKIKPV